MLMQSFVDNLNNNLIDRGYDFTVNYSVVNKNNVALDGLTLIDSTTNIHPIVYITEEMLEMSEDEFIRFLGDMYEKHKVNDTFDIDSFMNKDYIYKNCEARLVGSKDNMLLHKVPYVPYLEDFAIIFSVSVGEGASITITDAIYDNLHLDLNILYKKGIENLQGKESVRSMREVISEMMGVDVGDDISPVFILSNQTGVYGAQMLLRDDVLKAFYDTHGTFAIIPSSTHEALLISEYDDVQSLYEMNQQVNDTEVSDVDRLATAIYIYDANGLHKAA